MRRVVYTIKVTQDKKPPVNIYTEICMFFEAEWWALPSLNLTASGGLQE